VPDFVHEVVESVVAGLAHDVDVGPQDAPPAPANMSTTISSD
jgi:hypothetical protein